MNAPATTAPSRRGLAAALAALALAALCLAWAPAAPAQEFNPAYGICTPKTEDGVTKQCPPSAPWVSGAMQFGGSNNPKLIVSVQPKGSSVGVSRVSVRLSRQLRLRLARAPMLVSASIDGLPLDPSRLSFAQRRITVTVPGSLSAEKIDSVAVMVRRRGLKPVPRRFRHAALPVGGIVAYSGSTRAYASSGMVRPLGR